MRSIRNIFVISVLVCAFLFCGVINADGKLDLWNWSNSAGTGEYVDISDSGEDITYLSTTNKLHVYLTDDPNGLNNPLGLAAINDQRFFSKKMFFKADETLADGSDNILDINFNGIYGGHPDYWPLNMTNKNIILRQDPNTPSASKDLNVYDLIELTSGFSSNAHISLPDITASTPRSPAHYDIWEVVITNWADLDFNGKVNISDFALLSSQWSKSDCDASNNYCDFSDIGGSGTVDITDLSAFVIEWMWDADDPNSW